MLGPPWMFWHGRQRSLLAAVLEMHALARARRVAVLSCVCCRSCESCVAVAQRSAGASFVRQAFSSHSHCIPLYSLLTAAGTYEIAAATAPLRAGFLDGAGLGVLRGIACWGLGAPHGSCNKLRARSPMHVTAVRRQNEVLTFFARSCSVVNLLLLLLLADKASGAKAARAGKASDVTEEVPLGVGMPALITSVLFTNTKWHVEDAGLGCGNRLRFGAAKAWLVAPTRQVMEKMHAVITDAGHSVTEHLYSRSLLPYMLPVDKVLNAGMVPIVQEAGTTIITAHGEASIRVTVSSGLSLAESATASSAAAWRSTWKPAGRAAGPCNLVMVGIMSEPTQLPCNATVGIMIFMVFLW